MTEDVSREATEAKPSSFGQWQPEDMDNLSQAIARLERELPGWWWRVGSCHVSADATIGPDSVGPDADLLEFRTFDEGFDCDLRQPSSCGRALNKCIDKALYFRRTLGGKRSALPSPPDVSKEG